MGDSSGAGDSKIEKNDPSKNDAPSQLDADLLASFVHGVLDEVNGYVCKGQFAEALECIAKGFELNPPDDILAILYYKRAGVHLAMENWAEVIQDTTSALEKRPLFVSALFRRKEANRKLGKFEEVVTDLFLINYLGEFDSSHVSDDVEAALGVVGRVEADKLIKTLQPKMPPKRGAAYFMEDFYNDPVGNWWNTGNVTENGDKDYEPGRFAEAVKLFHAQDYSKIIELCNKEISDSGSEFKDEAVLLRGVVKFLWCYSSDEFLQDFDLVINSTTAKKSLKASAWMRKGIAYVHRLRIKDEALACLDKALELNPESVDTHIQRGHAILEFDNDAKSFTEARKCAKQAMEILPGYSHAEMMEGYLRFAAASLNKEKVEKIEAMKNLNALTEKYPNSAYVQNAYGFALKRIHEYFSANVAFSRASKLEPENSIYKAQEIMALYDLIDDAEATLAALNAIVESDDQAAHVYEHIANVKHVNGDVEGALKAAEEGLKVAWLYQDFMSLSCLKKAMEVALKVRDRLESQLVLDTHAQAQDEDLLAKSMTALLLGLNKIDPDP